jgi:hypothetical protein
MSRGVQPHGERMHCDGRSLIARNTSALRGAYLSSLLCALVDSLASLRHLPDLRGEAQGGESGCAQDHIRYLRSVRIHRWTHRPSDTNVRATLDEQTSGEQAGARAKENQMQ